MRVSIVSMPLVPVATRDLSFRLNLAIARQTAGLTAQRKLPEERGIPDREVELLTRGINRKVTDTGIEPGHGNS